MCWVLGAGCWVLGAVRSMCVCVRVCACACELTHWGWAVQGFLMSAIMAEALTSAHLMTTRVL